MCGQMNVQTGEWACGQGLLVSVTQVGGQVGWLASWLARVGRHVSS